MSQYESECDAYLHALPEGAVLGENVEIKFSVEFSTNFAVVK
jgi:hypothetical protein